MCQQPQGNAGPLAGGTPDPALRAAMSGGTQDPMQRFMLGSGQMPQISLQRYAGPIMGGGSQQIAEPPQPTPGMGRAGPIAGPAARASTAGGMGTQNDRQAAREYPLQAPNVIPDPSQLLIMAQQMLAPAMAAMSPQGPGVPADPTAADASMFPPGAAAGGIPGMRELMMMGANALRGLPRAPLVQQSPAQSPAGHVPTAVDEHMFASSGSPGMPPSLPPMVNPAAAAPAAPAQAQVPQPPTRPNTMAGQMPPIPNMPQPNELLVNQRPAPAGGARPGAPVPQPPTRPGVVPQPPTRPAGMSHNSAFMGDDPQSTMMRDINMIRREQGLPPLFT